MSLIAYFIKIPVECSIFKFLEYTSKIAFKIYVKKPLFCIHIKNNRIGVPPTGVLQFYYFLIFCSRNTRKIDTFSMVLTQNDIWYGEHFWDFQESEIGATRRPDLSEFRQNWPRFKKCLARFIVLIFPKK